MGYILLGHGGLDVDTGVTDPEMEYVAVPAGTTIQFYSDTGQGLLYGRDDLNAWEQLQAPWPAIDSSRVTYNLSLYNAAELWDDELRDDPSFGGHTLVRAGVDGVPDPIRMCTGTPQTCPTSPVQVAEGATHTCDGILAQYSGDLYWLACTVLENAAKATETQAVAGRADNVAIGEDPEWIPDEADFAAIAEVNGTNVKDAGDGEELDYRIGGFVFLIGEGHEEKHSDYADNQEDALTGTVTVHKGGAFDAGSLEVDGVPPAKQGVVEDAVQRFSDKKVSFG